MPLRKVKFIEVYPSTQQERQMLVDTDLFAPEDSDGGTPVSVAWGDITGKPDSFTPSAHDHPELVELIWFLTA